ncbi:MAG: cation:proton antiporter [Planctomycetota bacterium]|nr:cation:proton antiporter [Planctomycetota bacterium]MDW8372422.1 cation:proton antiporter [Planctomycetota bacterium]
MGELGAILGLLALGVIIVTAFQRLGVSALVAYLATGALAGPSALGLIDRDTLQPLAEVGAALLLFTLGLELDLGSVRQRWRATAIASLTQIGLTIGAGALVAALAGLPPASAVAIGACLAMTSSIVLMRALEERRLRNRPEGQLALAVSLMQDLAIGPLLVLLALLAPVGSPAPLPSLIGGVLLFGAGTVLLRQALASRLIARLRANKLPELEAAFAVTVALGAALIAERLGLGAAFGAFAAGLALGEQRHRELIAVSTRPLTGLTAICFFAAMGALFDIGFVAAHWPQVSALLVGALLIKAPLAALAVRLAGLPWRPALGCGLLLAQVGEFAFVLAAAAFARSSDPALRHLYDLVVAVTCISLATAPLLTRLARPLLPVVDLTTLASGGDSVVVAGLGPVGNSVVAALRQQGVPLLLVDRNERLLAPWQGVPGVRTHRGRIEDMEEWMPLLGHRPALVVLTFPIADTSAAVASRLRALDPALRILARAPYTAQVAMLREAGVHEVICDEDETTRALLPRLARLLADRAPLRERLRQTCHSLGLDPDVSDSK